MERLDWKSLGAADRRAALARPPAADPSGLLQQVREIIATVRHDGDAALREFESATHGELGAVSPYWWTIRFDNMWDLIRGSPRFRALMALQQTYIDHQRTLLADMRRKGEIASRDAP